MNITFRGPDCSVAPVSSVCFHWSRNFRYKELTTSITRKGSPELLRRWNTRHFSALTNVAELVVDGLDIPDFMRCKRRCFGHFFPTVRSLPESTRPTIVLIGTHPDPPLAPPAHNLCPRFVSVSLCWAYSSITPTLLPWVSCQKFPRNYPSLLFAHCISILTVCSKVCGSHTRRMLGK